jgi:cytoskeletal protein RodZ
MILEGFLIGTAVVVAIAVLWIAVLSWILHQGRIQHEESPLLN